MEAYEYYKKETGKLYYKEAALELELTDDYINWLERNVVKLFAIPAVVGRSEQFYCDGQENGKDRCETQCLGCAGMQEIYGQ
jgi:hypothetical protein